MPLHPTFAALIANPSASLPEDEHAVVRCLARIAWTRRTTAALADAQDRADEAWMRLVREFPDDEDIDPPPEQAALDAILAELHAVRDKDLWPRKLYWSL